MLVIYFIGMPGSGKTTLAKMLVERLRVVSGVVVNFVEVSDVVREWLRRRGNAVSILSTELKSDQLYNVLYGESFCVEKNIIHVVSGVREEYLLSPPREHADVHSIVIGLECDREIRAIRYLALSSREFTFEDADTRALQMGVPSLIKKRADFTIDTGKSSVETNVELVYSKVIQAVFRRKR